jgi:hypothetical protein
MSDAFVLDLMTEIAHLPTDGEDSLTKCGMEPDQWESIEEMDQSQVCPGCQSGDMTPRMYESVWPEVDYDEVEAFMQDLAPHFVHMLREDHGEQFMVEFALYHKTDLTAFEIQRETNVNVADLVDAEGKYLDLFHE